MRLAHRGFFDFLKPMMGKPRRLEPKPRQRQKALDTLYIEHEGAPLAVDVHIRENARRMILKIDRRSGQPALTLPRGIGKLRAERFLTEHIGWLTARLQAQPARINFQEGALVPVRGEVCRIIHRTPFRGETRIMEEEGGRLLVVHGDPAHLAGRIERFLRAEAEHDLAAAVARHAATLGVTFGRITLKDTRSRWGSCTARGDLAFSWRLILAPPLVLDYLAAHEVAHRLEMNHSIRYWRHVARIFPDYRLAEDWLRRHGADLHRYARSG
jgi:predicted metal-dependent hydrolase